MTKTAQLAVARAAGRRVTEVPAEADAAIVLLADDRQALAGTLAPAEDCQAVVSANPALAAAIGRCFTPRLVSVPLPAREAAPPRGEPSQIGWLDWEQRKQHRLLAAARSPSCSRSAVRAAKSDLCAVFRAAHKYRKYLAAAGYGADQARQSPRGAS